MFYAREDVLLLGSIIQYSVTCIYPSCCVYVTNDLFDCTVYKCCGLDTKQHHFYVCMSYSKGGTIIPPGAC